MKCPFCKKSDSRVIDSRAAEDGTTIRRRRECIGCGRRFTTYEAVEKLPLMVAKSDGSREEFDAKKIMQGVARSCNKRGIPADKMVTLVSDVERDIRNTMEREVSSQEIGRLVMERLKDLDDVAYIRFASVYQKFTDVSSFLKILETIKSDKKS